MTKYKGRYGYSVPMSVPRNPKPVLTCNFRRVFDEAIANNSTVEVNGTLSFQLSDVQNYTNYTGIFDQYRINYVVIVVEPLLTEVVQKPYDDSTTPGGTQIIPEYVFAIDRDDTTAGGYDTLRARSYSWVRKATQSLILKFKPNKLVQLYRSATTTGYKVDNDNSFIDCAQSNVPHYGLKYSITPASPSNGFPLRIRIMYNISFADRRV